MKRMLAVVLAVVVVLSLGATVALAKKVEYVEAPLTGNGAPSGAHYTLNIIGVPHDKTADMTDTNRHVIFVDLWSNGQPAKIMLSEGDFQVLDGNGTDGTAAFRLPNPDPDGDGTTVYSVFARPLGTPGGKASMVTCATWEGPDGIFGTADDEQVVSMAVLEVERTNGKQKFENVSKYLLYIYADLDQDGYFDTLVPLFDEDFQDFLWQYDNEGLKVLQLRFYEIPTTVPSSYPFE